MRTREENKNGLVGLIMSATIVLLAVSLNAADKGASPLSSDAKKLKLATQSLHDAKTRKRSLKVLWSLAGFAKRKKADGKFVVGCQSLAVLSRAARHAVGYEKEKHEFLLPPIEESRDSDIFSIDNKKITKINKLLRPFDDYSAIGDWSYQKNSPGKFSNPRLLPFIELAYLKAMPRNNDDRGSAELKKSLKMLTYAEFHTEGLDKAETLCQYGELLRELKEFKRAETYLNNALEYGDHWFVEKKVSENGGENEALPGTERWRRLKARINRLLFLLSFDLLETDYGEAYATYVKTRALIAKKEWWRAFPLAIKLKDEYPDTVYGEYGGLSWCGILLENDKAEDMRDKSLPSGVGKLEKFIADKPYGLYRGEALMKLGKFYLEYKWDADKASVYYKKALAWFREIRERKDAIDLYAVPAKVANISAPRGKLSNLNQWRLTEYRKPGPKEIINSKNAPWYISENEKTCLFMVGFFRFMDGEYDEAKKYFEQVKEVDANVAKLVGLNWPNVYWRLISACNIKRMIFSSEDKKYLKGKNKLRIAFAELNYICEKFRKAKQLYQDVYDSVASSDKEKAIALIGIVKATDHLPKSNLKTKVQALKLLDVAIKLSNKSSIQSEALFTKGLVYLSVGWDNSPKEALKCFEQYLKQRPKGVRAIEAQFHQMDIYLDIGEIAKAERLFKQYDYKNKYPDSGFTLSLLNRFKKEKRRRM